MERHPASRHLGQRQHRTVAAQGLDCLHSQFSQQVLPCCFGGHGIDPYEQNTQQSPGFGLSTSAQDGQSRKNWHASTGIVTVLRCPHFGQVSWQFTFMTTDGISRDRGAIFACGLRQRWQCPAGRHASQQRLAYTGAMPCPAARVGLHLLLIVSLLLPAIAMPARAATQAWQSTAAGSAADHGDVDMAQPTSHKHCQKGCCPQQSCDLTACIATGCLPRFASLPAMKLLAPFTFSWHSITPPTRLVETPLRPPIA